MCGEIPGKHGAFTTYHFDDISIQITKFRMGLPGGSDSKEPTCNAGDQGSIPGSRRIPWRRKWQPIPVFFPGESHGQRSLVGYSPHICKESDMTEAT